jgi:hypothetical protein
MRYSLNLNFQGGVLDGLGKDDSKLQALSPRLDGVNLLNDLKYYGPVRSKKPGLVRLSHWSEVKHGSEDRLHFANSDKSEAATKLADIFFSFDRILIDVIPSSDEGAALAKLIDAVPELVSIAQESSLDLAVWSGIVVLEARLKRPRPPRNLGPIRQDAVLDVINVRSPSPPTQLSALMENLESELPKHTSLTKLGDYWMINWVASIKTDQKSLETAMTARLAWYYDNDEFPVFGNYNQLGDSLVGPLNPVEDPFYTLYSPFNGMAYKALAGLPERLSEEALIATMQDDLRRGSTREGRSLKSVTLIVPSRDLAVKYSQQARDLDFKSVVYPDNEGDLWNPFPEDDPPS